MRSKTAILILITFILSPLAAQAQTPQTLSYYAGFYRGKGQFQKAADLYSRMADLYANDPNLGKHSVKYGWALSNMAVCEHEIGNDERANALIERALEYASESADKSLAIAGYLKQIRQNSVKILGEAKTTQMLGSAAESEASQGVGDTKQADDWQATLQQSIEAFHGGRLERAEVLAKRACEVAQPNDLQAQNLCLNSLAAVEILIGDLDKAESTYNKLIRLFKDPSAYGRHSNYDECVAYLSMTALHLKQNKIYAAEKMLSVAESLIAQNVPRTARQEANRQKLLVKLYSNKADIAEAQGQSQQSQLYRELAKEALKRSL